MGPDSKDRCLETLIAYVMVYQQPIRGFMLVERVVATVFVQISNDELEAICCFMRLGGVICGIAMVTLRWCCGGDAAGEDAIHAFATARMYCLNAVFSSCMLAVARCMKPQRAC